MPWLRPLQGEERERRSHRWPNERVQEKQVRKQVEGSRGKSSWRGPAFEGTHFQEGRWGGPLGVCVGAGALEG